VDQWASLDPPNKMTPQNQRVEKRCLAVAIVPLTN